MLQLNKSFNTQQLTQFPPHNSQENIFSLPHPKEKKMVHKTGAPFTYHTILCAMFFFWFHNVSYKKIDCPSGKTKTIWIHKAAKLLLLRQFFDEAKIQRKVLHIFEK